MRNPNSRSLAAWFAETVVVLGILAFAYVVVALQPGVAETSGLAAILGIG